VAEVGECARDGFVIVLRASLRSWGTKCESRQGNRTGHVKRWSTEMEMLVLKKWPESEKRSEIK